MSWGKKTTQDARHMTEEQKERARQRTREYVERTGGAAPTAYRSRTIFVGVTFNPSKDEDLIGLFESGRPNAGEIKTMLRELIHLRETKYLWRKAAEILTEDEPDGERESG